VGHPTAEGTTFGPVNNANQYNFVKDLVERTRQAGAHVVELGEKNDPERWEEGYYLRPALVGHPDPAQEIVVTEQFGPVVPILPYRDEAEAIAMANSTEFGLGSSVWSSDFERATAFSRRLEAGMTFINKNAQSRLGRQHMPFGGVKQSGIGTENSELGLAEYVEYHAINYHK
jgi:acyl-CoA reductase-like NAD-dependent aldehyde dehydrogenase